MRLTTSGILSFLQTFAFDIATRTKVHQMSTDLQQPYLAPPPPLHFLPLLMQVASDTDTNLLSCDFVSMAINGVCSFKH